MTAIVKIRDARLAFPNLFKPRPGEDGGKAKYGALFIMDPSNPAVKEIEKISLAVAKEKWPKTWEAIVKGLKAQDKMCIHDGATKSQYNGFPDNMFISANSDIAPTVLDIDKSRLTETSGKPYAGSYVIVSVEIWAQDNKFGKRINAQLRGVQFQRHGDAFAAGSAASEDEFEEELADQGDDTDPTA
jgi:hypothetical protein